MSYIDESGSKELSTTYTSDRLPQPLILSGGVGYGQNESLPLRDYLLVLYRYRLGIVTCALLGAALVSLANYVSVPIYSATSVVNIGTYIPPLDGEMSSTLRAETQRQEYVKNQITLLESNTIANKVLSENPDILEYYGYGEYAIAPTSLKAGKVDALAVDEEHQGYDIPINALEDYLRNISYTRVYETTMVRISATARTPEMSSKIANAHANAFISLVRQNRLRAANVNLKFLEKRAQSSAERTAAAERELVDYALKNNISTSSLSASDKSINLSSLKQNLAGAALERAEAEAQVREQRNRSQSAANLEYSPALHSQYLELSKLRAEMDQIRSINRNAHVLKFYKEQVENIEKTLRQYNMQQVRDSELRLKVASQKERILRSSLEEAERKSLEGSQSAVEYNLLERQHQAAKENHVAVTQRLEDAIVNAENDQKTVILVDPALPPTAPSNLSESFTPWHGMFLGTLLGIGLAILLHVLDNKIRTVNDVQASLNVPLLGVVPSFSKGNLSLAVQNGKEGAEKKPSDTTILGGQLSQSSLGSSGVYSPTDPETGTGFFPVQTEGLDPLMGGGSQTMSVPLSASFVQSALNGANGPETEIIDRSLVLVSAPFSSESEAFRTVLTTLTYSSSETMPKTMLITSGQQGDGKSTVAANLAVALAEASGSTLLIDADLRLPSIHKHFNRPRLTPGLSDYLSNQRDYNEVIHRGNIHNLSVMFAGNPVLTPGMLLQSKKMNELIELLSDEFDHIVLDGPPLNQVADALLLSRLADGVVLVVRSGKTPKPVAQSAVQHLQQIRANVLGTVLNGVERTRANKQGDYYYIMEQYPRSNA